MQIILKLINIHSQTSNPTPLLISHGWPGSVCEFLHIIERLAHPERFGGSVEDAFDVIAPSLPGFGFSGRPSRPMGPRRMAAHLNKLMTEQLGYKAYMAQGGDWGGAICSWLGFDHPKHCQAIHINILTMRHGKGPQTPDELAWEQKFERDQLVEDGYRTIGDYGDIVQLSGNPITDDLGRLVCDPNCYTREQQAEEFVLSLFEVSPYVLVE